MISKLSHAAHKQYFLGISDWSFHFSAFLVLFTSSAFQSVCVFCVCVCKLCSQMQNSHLAEAISHWNTDTFLSPNFTMSSVWRPRMAERLKFDIHFCCPLKGYGNSLSLVFWTHRLDSQRLESVSRQNFCWFEKRCCKSKDFRIRKAAWVCVEICPSWWN